MKYYKIIKQANHFYKLAQRMTLDSRIIPTLQMIANKCKSNGLDDKNILDTLNQATVNGFYDHKNLTNALMVCMSRMQVKDSALTQEIKNVIDYLNNTQQSVAPEGESKPEQPSKPTFEPKPSSSKRVELLDFTAGKKQKLQEKLNSLYQSVYILRIPDKDAALKEIQAASQGDINVQKLLPLLEGVYYRFPKEERYWTQLDNLRNIIAELKGEPAPEPTRAVPSAKNYSENTAEEAEEYAKTNPLADAGSKQQPAKQLAPIPVETQKQLNEILMDLSEQGLVFHKPIKEDGKVGPETMQALKTFAERFNAKGQTLKQLMDKISLQYNMLQTTRKQ